MVDTPPDRKALVDLMTAEFDYTFGLPKTTMRDAMEAALRAAEDAGVSMQPDEATSGMRFAGANIRALRIANRLNRPDVSEIFKAMSHKSPFRRTGNG